MRGGRVTGRTKDMIAAASPVKAALLRSGIVPPYRPFAVRHAATPVLERGRQVQVFARWNTLEYREVA